MYTATATAYLPWQDPRRPSKQAFEVDVAYDRTRLAKDDQVRVDVTVRSNLPGVAKMGIVDLGVPPGFGIIPDALEAAVKKGVLQRYSLAGRQIILYVAELDPKRPLKVRYDLRARFPVRVATGAARAYEYYDPANVGLSAPSKIVVE